METTELIFKGILALLNACALMFTLILVSKWHRRMEDKMDKIEDMSVMYQIVTILFTLTSFWNCKDC